MSEHVPTTETDVLIIGTGPAGAAAACALATYGVSNMVINKYGFTCRTPRAHITNQRTMELLRDLGLEREVEEQGVPHELMGENTYCTSVAGDELGRIKAWGTHPLRKADYDLASPTKIHDLPQNLMEPIVIRAAAHRGAKVRFNTEYLGLEQDANGVTARLRDGLTGQEYDVRCKYLIGADGANSKVLQDIDLPLEGKMGLSGSMNIVFEADLSRYVEHRPSILYWVIQPGSDVGGLGIGVVRMVRPWWKWLAIWGFEVDQGPPDLTEELATSIVHKLIGDHDIPVKIDSTSTWTVNDTYATEVMRGRVFCVGDAIHRHPPTNALGSNTSMQDSYNLAWKLASVIKGQAAPSLLDTYNTERAPVAKQIVKRANKSLGDFPPILGALGLLDAKDPEQMRRNMAALQDNNPEAAARRAALQHAIDATEYIYNAHGVELNQRYDSSAVVSDGTPDPGYSRDEELYYEATTWPGAHMPHVWLLENGRQISTLDLCGKGRFALITGTGGEAWQAAATAAEAAYGVEIAVHIIGHGRELEDPYGDFARIRDTTETGAILVRPDLHVAWRADSISDSASADLVAALGQILGRATAA